MSFRIYGLLGKDARTRVGDYVQIGVARGQREPICRRPSTKRSGIGEEFTIEDAVQYPRNTNCYEGWENELRYIMFRYEEHLAREQKLNFSNEQWEKIWMVSPSESIEHIWAKSKRPQKHRTGLETSSLAPQSSTRSYRTTIRRRRSTHIGRPDLLIAGEVADID